VEEPVDNLDIMGWAHERSAWFALTSGDYHRVVAESDHGMQVAGRRGVSVQMAAQSAKAWGRLKNRREVEVALDKGRSILEALPRPSNPDHHFQIDPAKWHFYEMDAYRLVGENPLAATYAEEVLRIGTAVNGEERSPMRNAEARVTLGVVAARAGDIDAAVQHGQSALQGNRRSLPVLLMMTSELATEIQHNTGKNDPRLRDFMNGLRQSALPYGNGAALQSDGVPQAEPELPEDWWTTEDVATYLGVSSSTVRAYLARNQMPEPDRRIGRMQLWRPKTIQHWHEKRPRKTSPQN
jgi:predicted DNA-binding transcriptional regulator AlpA